MPRLCKISITRKAESAGNKRPASGKTQARKALRNGAGSLSEKRAATKRWVHCGVINNTPNRPNNSAVINPRPKIPRCSRISAIVSDVIMTKAIMSFGRPITTSTHRPGASRLEERSNKCRWKASRRFSIIVSINCAACSEAARVSFNTSSTSLSALSRSERSLAISALSGVALASGSGPNSFKRERKASARGVSSSVNLRNTALISSRRWRELASTPCVNCRRSRPISI